MSDLWWAEPIAFLFGLVVGGSISNWLNRKLIKVQREYIAMLTGEKP